jgi:hypothetical protein
VHLFGFADKTILFHQPCWTLDTLRLQHADIMVIEKYRIRRQKIVGFAAVIGLGAFLVGTVGSISEAIEGDRRAATEAILIMGSLSAVALTTAFIGNSTRTFDMSKKWRFRNATDR